MKISIKIKFKIGDKVYYREGNFIYSAHVQEIIIKNDILGEYIVYYLLNDCSKQYSQGILYKNKQDFLDREIQIIKALSNSFEE